MQVSAIVLDLDGTLLNSAKEVSPRNFEAVLRCRECGIPVVIATARPPRTLKNMLPEPLLNLDGMIYYNGAMIIAEKQEISEHYPIAADLFSEFIDYLITLDGRPFVSVESKDRWYSSEKLDYSAMMKDTIHPEVIRLEDIRLLSASKLLLSNIDQSGARKLIERFGHRANIIVTDSGELIQIMRKNVSKEDAVARLCEIWGIPLRHVMVFGDDYNDAGLFRECGYPIAMGNAVDDLKTIAYEVTDTNDNDGVAVVLERLLNNAERGRSQFLPIS